MASSRVSLDPPGADSPEHLYKNGSSVMLPMEMDEEMDSLVQETGDFSNVISKLSHRKRYSHATVTSTTVGRAVTGFRGLLRTKTAYTVRNVIFMACLAWLVLLFVAKMSETLGEEKLQDEDPRGPHQNPFGGQENTGHPSGARAHHKHEMHQEDLNTWIQAEDNVGVPVKSINGENDWNHNGHYWHDPYQSPFASHLYNRTQQELTLEQQDFERKMNATKEKFGSWSLVDPFYEKHGRFRHRPDFDSVKNRDLSLDDFPSDSWQLDEEYVSEFVTQARSLIHRVKEGIYSYYYHPTDMDNGTKLSGQALKDRDALFSVIVDDYVVVNGKAVKDNVTDPLPGIAYLNRKAWDGLVHKLLHALITNDYFFVVLAGDEVAAGHRGNNFLQTGVMQFHHLMEPVFAFLGIQLLSRNMAMTYGYTTFSALGGADIYGEADIMWYHSPRRDETSGQMDLFHKQAILSGERVPLLLTPDPVSIKDDSNGAAWVGNLQPGAEMCPLSTEDTFESIPPSCRLVHCPDKRNMWACAEFNSVCWEGRIDVQPPVPQDDYIRVPRGLRVAGPRRNRLEAHKLSVLLLHALDAAFDKWVEGIETDDFPLIEKYWHVGELYDKTREAVRTHIPRFNENITECDGMFKDFPIVCHVEMHAFTEWHPRVNPDGSGLDAVLHPLMDDLDFEEDVLYTGIDVLPTKWKVPDDEVDVHAIAISTSIPPVEDNDNGYDFDDDYTDGVDTDDDLGTDEAPASAPTHGALFAGHSKATEPADNGGRRRAFATSHRHTEEIEDTTVINRTITPGKGWSVQNRIPGFCDGSAQSTCDRSSTNTCLLAGHNDFQHDRVPGILGDGLSGWLMLRVPNVKEGIILVRLATQIGPNSNPKTNGWTSVDQGNDGRHLNIPADFEFDYAINGKVTTLLRSEFLAFGKEVLQGMILYPLLLDESMSNNDGETVDVAIRIRSGEGRAATVLLTHLYYA